MQLTEVQAKALQLIIFKLKDGVTRDEFLATVGPPTEFALRQPGCIKDDLRYDEENDLWVDVVWWESLEHAQAANAAMEGSDAFPPMFEKIDMESSTMSFSEIVAGHEGIAHTA